MSFWRNLFGGNDPVQSQAAKTVVRDSQRMREAAENVSDISLVIEYEHRDGDGRVLSSGVDWFDL